MARRGENIYKRKDGRYEGRYIKHYDMSGKAVYGYIYSKSYTQIREQLAKCKTQKQEAAAGSGVKLDEWLNIWIKSQCGLKSTTKIVYKSHIKSHINPAIGNITLKKIDAEVLQNFVNDLECSPSTVKTVFSTLKSALKAAEDKGLIFNVWSKVKLPQRNKTFVKILSKSEQKQLECALLSQKDMGIWIALYTGLRIGELCALKWCDIDFENATLTVNGTQARTENGIEITPPKSKSSRRRIPIPSFLLDKLRAVLYKCEYVLSVNNNAMDVRTYSRYFKSVLKKANLPEIKFHATRHTFATRALEVGMDFKTLSEILGHSSVSITLDLYAHSLDEHKKAEMNKLCDIWKR